MINEQLIKKIEEYLNDVYKKKSHRLEHIYNVKKVAVALGEFYNMHIPSVIVASYLHDATKHKSIEENKSIVVKEIKDLPLACYHAYSAEMIAKEQFGIEDIDILNAIKYHCSGRIHMSMLEKIIYVADFIEDGRKFCPSELKTLAYEDIDKTVYQIMIQTKHYIQKHNQEFSNMTEQAIKNYELNRRI